MLECPTVGPETWVHRSRSGGSRECPLSNFILSLSGGAILVSSGGVVGAVAAHELGMSFLHLGIPYPTR